jgi:hypothetical protein
MDDDDDDDNKSQTIKKERSNSSRKNSDSWSRYGSSSSSICSTPSVAESESMHSTRYISSSMKKKKNKTSTKSSSSSRLSPTKVENFPLQKKVRFQLPKDHADESAHSRDTSYTNDSSVLSHNSYTAVLDTSTDLTGEDNYFCKCDSFLDYLEQNIMRQI